MSDVVERAEAARAMVLPEGTWAVRGCTEMYELLPELVAEVKDLRVELAAARSGLVIRPMTETESNLMTQVLQLRRVRHWLAETLVMKTNDGRSVKEWIESAEAAS